MRISANFDSGNIKVIRQDAPDDIELQLNKDNNSEFAQWFHFCLETMPFQAHTLKLTGLKDSAYPDAWDGYQAVASYDRETWFRVDSEFDEGTLTIEFTPENQFTWFAYFAPYSYDRHLDLVAWAQAQSSCNAAFLGHTLDGRDMTMLTIGEEDEGKLKVWITARQHPGETMAEWFVEGMLERLLNEDDAMCQALLERCVFYVIPNMNPDGSARGHLRTNANGVNLNRVWHDPQEISEPEVFYVLNQMRETGVDLYLDIHGDEAIPYNFIAGCEGNPGFDERMEQLEAKFSEILLTVTAEFQVEQGYPKDAPGEANMTVASNAVGSYFNCLALTVEMPFKDNDKLPDPLYGWSPERSKRFGEDMLTAIFNIKQQLR
ncbi:M14 family metallopeptidase [Planctobacterium marinum]|uniref:Peptidase M14 domain-containing protein n=1 Tax=Planctobacterium marinum TaxID=1631968 RepID=A0AA48KS05_9ALTE|nr:hypothetical protein MACH26_14950 [Planctobacterium marinum]